MEGVNGKGKGHVFFSMVSLSYTDLEMHQYRMILYAVKKSDLFSLITYQKKPYSKIPPNCEHDDILEIIKDSLVTQLVGIRKWSGSGENNNHVVMNVYKCDRATRMFLLGKTDLLKYSNTFPEDLCFYRGRKAWFSITTHEEYAAIYSETKEDLSFLNSCGISWSFQGDIRPYLLPELL